jgi:glycerol-1-phosphate dehydrogenase [NAD(P)+]
MDINMPVSIQYDESGKLLISGLDCGCPCEHSTPAQDIYVGKGLLSRLPEMIAQRGLGRKCVLVADTITYDVAGRGAQYALTEAGYEVILCVIRREGEMLPDERACGEVLLSIQPETEFLLSIGSGSVTDITRVNAKRIGLPFVCVGTAPSMDGYTSVISPLLLNGVKIHRAGVCPDIILCDLDILSTAPLHMVQAGVGDVLGKYIAVADWAISSLINGEPYCPVCGEIVLGAVGRLLANIEEIREKTEKGIRILIEALLLSGITIMIVGHTRAVASVEHNIAHYWEMMELLNGKKAPSHGSSVGVATLMVWPLFTRFAEEDLGALNLEAVREGRLSREEHVRWMIKAYGEAAGGAIMRDNPGDFLSWEEQLRRIEAAQAALQGLRDIIHALPPYQAILGAMRALGAPLTAADLGVSDSLRNLSMRCAKDYRTRYTLFKLIDECGLANEYMKEYPLMG